MNRLSIGICAAALLGVNISVFAQTATPTGSAAAGVSSSPAQAGALSYLVIEGASTQRDTQYAALQQAQRLFAAGSLTANVKTALYRTLTELAYSGTVDPTISGMTVINSYPDIRMSACRLLGQLGGSEASDILLQVLFNDPQSTVLSEAIFQLGRIGRNPHNEVSEAIASAFARQDAVRPDNNLAFACLLAFSSLAQANGGIADPVVLDMISRIQAEDYSGPVKAQAERVLEEIQKLG